MPKKRKRKFPKPQVKVTLNEHCIVCDTYTGCAVLCENCKKEHVAPVQVKVAGITGRPLTITEKELEDFRVVLAQTELDPNFIVVVNESQPT